MTSDEEAEDDEDDLLTAYHGSIMSEEEARQCEEELAADPWHPTARLRLLGYYIAMGKASPEMLARRVELILWLIRHDPTAPVLRVFYGQVGRRGSSEGEETYHKARRLWLESIEAHPSSPEVLAGAGTFFAQDEEDRARAIHLLERAVALEPDTIEGRTRRQEWRRHLVTIHRWNCQELRRRKDENAMRDAARVWLALAEEIAAEEVQPAGTWNTLLYHLAPAAYLAGEQEKARRYAHECLQSAEQERVDWNYVHLGWIILGNLMLDAGDLDSACRCLKEAGDAPDSRPLRTAGPNMGLALRLLRAGRWVEVQDYLKSVRKFWPLKGLLDQWEMEIAAGLEPDFGRQLTAWGV